MDHSTEDSRREMETDMTTHTEGMDGPYRYLLGWTMQTWEWLLAIIAVAAFVTVIWSTYYIRQEPWMITGATPVEHLRIGVAQFESGWKMVIVNENCLDEGLRLLEKCRGQEIVLPISAD